ncbi:hypothetical protein MmiHf6_16340 [Methanimicrococcus hongohii]|uniref:Uncharacterized protein n=1 Tax=Methanimicrococcus hongohii TaxID=3028295 RepID=A0AA96V3G8_9EURY|nr:hypothetical protein [Methanimicrococcus sp. Hf6]WNY24303.1 hypothetical protein MmiHf6_16340 [Methanimicrococcus sp. Hf6]
MKKYQKTLPASFAVLILLIAGAAGFWYYWFIADVNPNFYGLNPLHKPASVLESKSGLPPIPDDILEYYYSDNYYLSSMTADAEAENPFKAARRIKREADVVVYATLKEIQPAVETRPVSTPIVFEINHVVKGNVTNEITVQIDGGFTKTSGYWVSDTRGVVSPWDFTAGESYLLYLTGPFDDNLVSDTNYYTPVNRGVFILDEKI